MNEEELFGDVWRDVGTDSEIDPIGHQSTAITVDESSKTVNDEHEQPIEWAECRQGLDHQANEQDGLGRTPATSGVNVDSDIPGPPVDDKFPDAETADEIVSNTKSDPIKLTESSGSTKSAVYNTDFASVAEEPLQNENGTETSISSEIGQKNTTGSDVHENAHEVFSDGAGNNVKTREGDQMIETDDRIDEISNDNGNEDDDFDDFEEFEEFHEVPGDTGNTKTVEMQDKLEDQKSVSTMPDAAHILGQMLGPRIEPTKEPESSVPITLVLDCTPQTTHTVNPRKLMNQFTRPTRQFVRTDHPDPIVRWRASAVEGQVLKTLDHWRENERKKVRDRVFGGPNRTNSLRMRTRDDLKGSNARPSSVIVDPSVSWREGAPNSPTVSSTTSTSSSSPAPSSPQAEEVSKEKIEPTPIPLSGQGEKAPSPRIVSPASSQATSRASSRGPTPKPEPFKRANFVLPAAMAQQITNFSEMRRSATPPSPRGAPPASSQTTRSSAHSPIQPSSAHAPIQPSESFDSATRITEPASSNPPPAGPIQAQAPHSSAELFKPPVPSKPLPQPLQLSRSAQSNASSLHGSPVPSPSPSQALPSPPPSRSQKLPSDIFQKFPANKSQRSSTSSSHLDSLLDLNFHGTNSPVQSHTPQHSIPPPIKGDNLVDFDDWSDFQSEPNEPSTATDGQTSIPEGLVNNAISSLPPSMSSSTAAGQLRQSSHISSASVPEHAPAPAISVSTEHSTTSSPTILTSSSSNHSPMSPAVTLGPAQQTTKDERKTEEQKVEAIVQSLPDISFLLSN
uniref:ARAD1D07414p n=1 Tax=Blastobotrys adeninivorans TaxID=409370 RepID=A0A060T907_BLAAD